MAMDQSGMKRARSFDPEHIAQAFPGSQFAIDAGRQWMRRNLDRRAWVNQ
jgi:hypothetical protein